MANGRSDGSVIIDTKIDTSGIDKGMDDASRKITAAANSVSKLGNSIKQTFYESNSMAAGRSYEELQKEIRRTEIELDKLIERQIRFVETGGNIKSKAFAGMEYDIENTRNKLIGLQAQLQRVSEQTPASFNKMVRWTDRLKNAFTNLEKKTKKSHYSIMRMLGTSILFSTVFRAISTVTKGFTEGIGNLAQNSEKANETMSALKSSLTQLKNSFATAFMPLISAITPAITTMINMLIRATNYVSAFFSAIAGKTSYQKAVEVQEDYAASLDKTAQSAKNAQRYLSALDEIKTFNEKESTDVLPEDMFKEETVEAPIFNVAQIIKDAFKNGDWLTLGTYLSDGIVLGLNSLSEKLNSVDWKDVGDKIGQFIKGIDWTDLLSGVGELFWNALNAGIKLYEGLFDAAPIETAILTALAALKFTGIGSAIWGMIIGDMKLSMAGAGKKIKEVISLTIGGAGTLAESMTAVFGPIATTIAGIVAVVGGLVIAVKNFFDMLKDGFSWLKEIFMVIGIAIAAVGAIILGVPAAIAAVVAAIIAVVATLVVIIKEHWEEISAFFVRTWEKIATGCKNIWNGIKETAINVWDSIVDAIKKTINFLIGLINGMISGIVNGINSMVDALNGIKFSMPDWVPGIGGKDFGLNINHVTAPQIPMLATGAVIPPNAPFMAVLGDQTHGTNIEAPLDTIKQAVREVLGNTSGGGQYQFTAQINRRTLFDEFIDEAKLRQNISGRNPFDLGKGVMI